MMDFKPQFLIITYKLLKDPILASPKEGRYPRRIIGWTRAHHLGLAAQEKNQTPSNYLIGARGSAMRQAMSDVWLGQVKSCRIGDF